MTVGEFFKSMDINTIERVQIKIGDHGTALQRGTTADLIRAFRYHTIINWHIDNGIVKIKVEDDD